EVRLPPTAVSPERDLRAGGRRTEAFDLGRLGRTMRSTAASTGRCTRAARDGRRPGACRRYAGAGAGTWRGQDQAGSSVGLSARRAAVCWAHARREFYDLHVSGKAPLATEAITRIQALYAIEDDARGRRPDERRQIRQTRAKPLLADMKVWLEATLRRVPRRGDLAAAIHYVIKRWTALT